MAGGRILDEYLVVAAKGGDRKAFELLARRWERKLVAHAWRISGSVERARDAAQAGWLEIARSLPALQDERAFPAWAYRIVTRCCGRLIREAVRQRETLAKLALEPAPEEHDGAVILDADRLRAALRTLPPDHRAAVALFYLEELSVAEVAVALDVPAGTVKTRLMLARRKLRAALGGDEQ